MTNPLDLQVGDIGTVLRFTVLENDVAADISLATVKTLKLRKTDRTVIERTMQFSTDGSDGKVEYITILDDIDMDGRWTAQVYLEMPSGKWHTSKVPIDVLSNVDD